MTTYSRYDYPDGAILFTPTTSTPTPTPAPTPTPQPTGNWSFGAQNASLFSDLQAGVIYYAQLPSTADHTLNFGQGIGLTPTLLEIAIADHVGADVFALPDPQEKHSDPNQGGPSISWSLNPQGRTPWQARITDDRVWYAVFRVNMGGSVSHNWN